MFEKMQCEIQSVGNWREPRKRNFFPLSPILTR